MRSDVAVVLHRVVADLSTLEQLLGRLSQLGGPDEQVVEAAIASKMALAAIGPLEGRWAWTYDGTPLKVSR